MKKLLLTTMVVTLCCVMAACGGKKQRTPRQVAEKALQSVIDKNYKAYVDEVYFKNQESMDQETLEKKKAEYTEILQSKMEDTFKKYDGVKSYNITSEEVNDSVATVKYELTYGNGETNETGMDLILTENDGWKINSGK